LKTELESMAW